jgi:lipoic acid synthetase
VTGQGSSDTLTLGAPLRVRWLGRVPYREALALQRGLHGKGSENHLLLLEHDHVFTYGQHADLDSNLRCDPEAVGAALIEVDRGGDVTYHGPGQLVGYPIISLPNAKASLDHVRTVEDVIIDALSVLGADRPGRLDGYPGVWLGIGGQEPRKVAAIGVRLSRGRTLHGFGLNVATDMTYMRDHIIACGIADRPVTSLAEEGLTCSMADVANAVIDAAGRRWGSSVERQDVQWRHHTEDLTPFSRGSGPGEPVRLSLRARAAGIHEELPIEERKPEWLRSVVNHGPEVLRLRRTLRDLDLVTVCEDAGCPNLSECWSEGTATLMVLGERCTRACGFCLVDTRRPNEPDPGEPARVAEAIAQMGLRHAVLTMVARDDLVDGGMAHVAACVSAIRDRCPGTSIETLISDVRGDATSLELLLAASPDVVNHNLETVARLQRAARPSAGYARSLALLARAAGRVSVTKSGIIVGMGETDAEVEGALADLAAVGCDVVTIGQYLRPTTHHLPVARWVEPVTFERWIERGRELGIRHVEASPLTRSSHHAAAALEAVTVSPPVRRRHGKPGA